MKSMYSSCSMEPPSDLFGVIAACEQWRKKTGGAYSARSGTLLNDMRDGYPQRSARPASEMATAISNFQVAIEGLCSERPMAKSTGHLENPSWTILS